MLGTHLEEIDHVLEQLTATARPRSITWGFNGVDSQVSRIQGMTYLKTPTNVSKLCSFLGVCNYSRQFIESYADLAKPLKNF